ARALRELVTLYRRHRSLARLESEYRAQLATSDDWATLVILARLTPASSAKARALWRRALAAKPDDARGWLAVGDATANAAEARDAYRRAATHATSPRDKQRALIKLVGAA